jgi:serine/threonine protein kinase
MNVGPYRILEQIGLGGMATVFKAFDPGTERYVAIKIVSPHFAQHPEFRERFRREAKSIARLEHPHIIPVHAFGEEGETAYLVLRYMDTGTLRDLMNHHPLDFAAAGTLVSQIASALDYAHRNGVIHRDVKPSNVLIDSENNAYLTDFGIAKIVEATVELTGSGTAMGTPQYMSPEQCRGDKKLTAATDVYSLGVILYQMVTGTLPFDAETPLAVIHQHLNDPLPPPRHINPKVTEAMELVLLKALAKNPEDRYQSTSDLAQAFLTAMPKPERTRRKAPAPPPSAVAEALPAEARPTIVQRLPSWTWAAGGAVLLVAVIGTLLATGTLDFSGEPSLPTDTPLPAVAEQPPPTEPPAAAIDTAALNPDPSLLEDPIPYGERYYSLTQKLFSWEEAVQLARNLGGYLVSIGDQAENEFLYQTFAARYSDDQLAFWLGLRNIGQSGEFEWVSGEQVAYFRWDDGQPDSLDRGPVCIHMFPWGRWDDVPCSDDFRLLALIEFEKLPAEPVAMPAGLPQAVSVDLGPENASNGLWQRDFEGDGLTKPATIGGREVRVTAPNGTEGRYIYFRVDDRFIFREETRVIIAVEYFDQGNFPFGLDYDSSDDVFELGGGIELADSGLWNTVVFELGNAFFSGRQHEGADFRIGLGDQDLYIDRVTVARAGTPMAEAISDPWGHVFVSPDEAVLLGVGAALGDPVLGPFAIDIIDAVVLAVEQFGPIHGSTVEVKIVDSGCTREAGLNAARLLTSGRNKAGVVGLTCSQALDEAMPVLDAARLVFISPSATADYLSQAGLATFNRTIFSESVVPDSLSGEADPENPMFQDFAAAFEARYGRSCCERFAAHAYDAAMILLNAMQAVGVTDDAGNLVIPRQMLAEFVRETRGWPGASGEIYFNELGDRVLP